jgi:hypothetical protein
VVRWKSPGRTFPVNEQRLGSSVHHVLLDLGDVVRHVIDDVHVLETTYVKARKILGNIHRDKIRHGWIKNSH